MLLKIEKMDSIVEENGNNSNNIDSLSDVSITQASSNTPNSTTTTTVLTTGSNVVQFMPTHNIQVTTQISYAPWGHIHFSFYIKITIIIPAPICNTGKSVIGNTNSSCKRSASDYVQRWCALRE